MRNRLFTLLLLLSLVLGSGIFLLPQNRESAMEKRILATNDDVFFDDDLLKDSERVLKDQFYFRDVLVHDYYQVRIALNKATDKIISLPKELLRKIKGYEYEEGDELKDIPLTFLAEGTVETKDGYLIADIPSYDEEERNAAWARGDNVNSFDLAYPDIKTYVYFPTRIEELLNPDANYEPVCRQWFISQLGPDISWSALDVKDLDDHERYFFQSDLHWNAYGAYEAYKDIIDMINDDYDIGEAHPVKEEVVYPYTFHGNVANKIGGYGMTDQINDLILDGIGDFDYYVDGEEYDYYSDKERYREEGNPTIYSDYHMYFGENNFLRVFDFHNEERPNLLFFGDSYKNVNMMWIASHFNKTVILDLRSRPDDFDLDYYIENYDIDVALISYHYYYAYFDGHLFIPLD